ncbi:MAG: DUF3754 domain-containing protein [Planctomycetes bacterium]|nr:DUF3754 domain-containing protein [Planctomycetota bacterium]
MMVGGGACGVGAVVLNTKTTKRREEHEEEEKRRRGEEEKTSTSTSTRRDVRVRVRVRVARADGARWRGAREGRARDGAMGSASTKVGHREQAAGTAIPGLAAQDARFLPISRHALTRVLAEEGPFDAAARGHFVTFSALLAHVFHFLFDLEARELKRTYAPFDPDALHAPVHPPTSADKKTQAALFVERLEYVLSRANYRRIDGDELDALLSQHSPWALRLRVDRTPYAQFCLYGRGVGEEERALREVRTLFRARRHRFAVFRRLVLVVQFKPVKGLPAGVEPDAMYLKLFKNIPCADLEMLFPNTVPEMKLTDKVRVVVPLLSGTGTTVIKILGAAALSMVAALMLAAGFLGYAIKSFFGFLQVKEKYHGALVTSLYFNSLDNNQGVIHHLIDQAEEEECKEALLAYTFLLTEPKARQDEATLDARIERFLAARLGVRLDFEAPDALAKLERLELLERSPEGALRVCSLPEALRRLDRAWDGYFTFAADPEEA